MLSGLPPAAAKDEPPRLTGKFYYEVRLLGSKAGFSEVDYEAMANGATRCRERSVLSLRRQTLVIESETVAEAVIGPGFALQSFAYTRKTTGLAAQVVELKGKAQDGHIAVESVTGGVKSRQQVPISGAAPLPAVCLRQRIHALGVDGGFKPGFSLEMQVFIEESASIRPYKFTVVRAVRPGGSVPQGAAFEALHEFMDMRTTEWIDAHGTPVASTMDVMGMQFASVLAGAEVTGGAAGAELPDVFTASLVEMKGKSIPQGARFVRLRLRQGTLKLPEDARQRRTGDVIELMRRPAGALAHKPSPDGPAGAALQPYLEPAAYVQSADAGIVAAAARAAGNARNPAETAEALTGFVFGYIAEKNLGAGFLSAKEVLEGRAGDCTEHSVLLAALLRARGIPARLVFGLVHADGVFGYHQWNEAWLGGEWIGLDATFNQFPANAAHIKLGDGRGEHSDLVDTFSKLMSGKEKLAFEVLEAR